MLHAIQNYKRFVAGLGLATMLTVSMAAPTLAVDTVTVGITSDGVRSASYADPTIPSVPYSLTDGTTGPQTMTLTAADATGTGAGWNVTVQSSAFVYTGTNDAGTDIAASNFSFGTPGTPAAVGADSQTVDTDPTTPGGPKAVVTGGPLDTPVKVIEAEVGFGQGTYTQTVDATLTIPAKSVVGTYTGTLTTTIYAGPDGTI